MDLRIIHAKDVRRFIMIYQFEHEEIDICNNCPMCVRVVDTEGCMLTQKLISGRKTPRENDCPLVAISKTETTSCELLNHNMNYKKCSSCNHLIHVYVNKPNYCPNCGKSVKEIGHV